MNNIPNSRTVSNYNTERITLTKGKEYSVVNNALIIEFEYTDLLRQCGIIPLSNRFSLILFEFTIFMGNNIRLFSNYNLLYAKNNASGSFNLNLLLYGRDLDTNIKLWKGGDEYISYKFKLGFCNFKYIDGKFIVTWYGYFSKDLITEINSYDTLDFVYILHNAPIL